MKPEYKKHKDHEKKIKSAITAIKAILPLELYLAHKKELLSICIWKITEADGKYNASTILVKRRAGFSECQMGS